jgi:hypothetical protein
LPNFKDAKSFSITLGVALTSVILKKQNYVYALSPLGNFLKETKLCLCSSTSWKLTS